MDWLRGIIGETKHEAFAAEIGMSRQVLSGVLNGRRPLSPHMLKRLKPYGLIGVRRLYRVLESSTTTPVKP